MIVLTWLLFGLVVGVVASMLDHKDVRGQLPGSMLLAGAGALLGGFMANLMFGIPLAYFNPVAFVLAAIASLSILFLGRKVSGI